MLTRLWVVALLVPACGCGSTQEVGPVPSGPADSSASQPDATNHPVIDDLTCHGDRRVVGTLDYVAGASGAPTLDDAVSSWVGTDDFTVQDLASSRVDVFVLRADGTAHTRVQVSSRRDGTWRVESMESCRPSGAPQDGF